MAGARRDVPEPETSQQLADRALVISDMPAGQDQLPQVNAPPAHNPITLEIGAGFDQCHQLSLLLRSQSPRRPRWLAVDQSPRTFGVEAMDRSRIEIAPPAERS